MQNPVEQNSRLFANYKQKLSTGNIHQYNEYALKMCRWLSDEKAYYTAARQDIITIIYAAQAPLRRASGGSPDISAPFNIQNCLQDPRALAYIRLVNVIQPYRHLFVEPELQIHVKNLIQSIQTDGKPITLSQSLALASGSHQMITPQTSVSEVTTAESQLPPLPTAGMVQEKSVEPQIEILSQVSTLSNSMQGVLVSSEANSSAIAVTALKTPKGSAIAPSQGVTRKRTKKKRGTLDLTSLVQRDAVGLQWKQGQSSQAPLIEVKVEPSDDVISNVLTKREMSSTPIHMGSVPYNNAPGVTPSSMSEIIDLTNDDEDYSTPIDNLEKDVLWSNPVNHEGEKQDQMEDISEQTVDIDMKNLLSTRPVHLTPITSPIAINDSQPAQGGVDGQEPFCVDQDAHIPISLDVSDYDAMLIDQIGDNVLKTSSNHTERHDIGGVIEQIAEPHTVKLTNDKVVGDSSSNLVDKRKSGLWNQLKGPSNALEEIIDQSLERVQSSFQGHDIQDIANTAGALDQSVFGLESALHTAIEQESMDTSVNFTESDQMTGEISKGLFTRDMFVIAAIDGQVRKKARITFSIPSEHLNRISDWVNCARSNVELQNVQNSMCFSMACYLAAELKVGANQATKASLIKQVSALKPIWPQSGVVTMNVKYNDKRMILPLAPPFVVTPDGLVDISQFITPGENWVELHHSGDTSQFAFVLLIHHPTISQLREVTEKRQKNRDWQGWLHRMSLPIEILHPST